MNRRNFCKNTVKGSLAIYALAQDDFAICDISARGDDEVVEPHFFLFLQHNGAWDVCLAFEPKDRDELLPSGEKAFDQPYAYNEVRIFNNIPLAPDGFVLGNYADRLAIINGIDMEADTGHQLHTMMGASTTARQLRLPFYQLRLCKLHPYLRSCALSHIYTSYDGDFEAGELSALNVTVIPADIPSLMRSVDTRSRDVIDLAQLMLTDYRQAINDNAFERLLRGYHQNLLQCKQLIEKVDSLQLPQDVRTPEALAELIGRLFASGILGSATLSVGSNYEFDTHNNHYATHPLKTALTDLDSMCKKLKELPLDDNTSVFDKTTIILTSEYCRTPRLNGNQGKDHNSHSNSMVMLGYQVKAGVFGKSGARLEQRDQWRSHAGLPIDFATGQYRADGDILHAANLWAGLGPVVDVDLSRQFGTAKPIRFL